MKYITVDIVINKMGNVRINIAITRVSITTIYEKSDKYYIF